MVNHEGLSCGRTGRALSSFRDETPAYSIWVDASCAQEEQGDTAKFLSYPGVVMTQDPVTGTHGRGLCYEPSSSHFPFSMCTEWCQTGSWKWDRGQVRVPWDG